MDIRPFSIDIPDATLTDLRTRLAQTRWPQAINDPKSHYGIDPATVKRWCDRWTRFDWSAQQARLNAFDQFITTIDGIDLHFVHIKSANRDATPLLLMNGWPSTFAELTGLIEPLTHGDPAFHIIIPSLPGFGFSSQPTEPGWNLSRMAKAMAELMSGLGYARFAVHGSDMGAGVMLALAAQAPERLIAMHTVNVYWAYPKPDDLTDAEAKWYAEGQSWQMVEGGYAMIQASKPQTLAPALNDSPAGMAAWILEKWQGWSDGGLDSYDPNDVLTNLTIFWSTGTIGSSVRLYAEVGRDPEAKHITRRSEIPTGALILPHDLLPAPRDWGHRWLNIIRWTEATKGGHFPALEVPELLVEELRATFRGVADAAPASASKKSALADA